MKSSIIFLGLVALSFTSVNATNEYKSQDLDQQEFTTLNVNAAQDQQNQLVVDNQTTTNEIVENTGDTLIFNPNTVIDSYTKTTEEVVEENKLITEAKEFDYRSLSIETTVEDKIAENNQIIESTVSDETYPLDFNKINRSLQCAKAQNNTIIVVDLKL